MKRISLMAALINIIGQLLADVIRLVVIVLGNS
jgi:hypothetical protein